MQLNSSVFARYHESILDMEKVIRKAQLIQKIEDRAQDSYGAAEEEITLIQEEITNYRLKIRQLDSDLAFDT